jgi:hypothetical protein
VQSGVRRLRANIALASVLMGTPESIRHADMYISLRSAISAVLTCNYPPSCVILVGAENVSAHAVIYGGSFLHGSSQS